MLSKEVIFETMYYSDTYCHRSLIGYRYEMNSEIWFCLFLLHIQVYTSKYGKNIVILFVCIHLLGTLEQCAILDRADLWKVHSSDSLKMML